VVIKKKKNVGKQRACLATVFVLCFQNLTSYKFQDVFFKTGLKLFLKKKKKLCLAPILIIFLCLAGYSQFVFCVALKRKGWDNSPFL
jgi:hypothetical protein